MSEMVPIERVESKIYLIRGQKVILDNDLANLYGVETKYLKRQVKRNMQRFPQDFMFQLTIEEECLRCQNVTSKTPGRGGSRYLPYAFTEQGIAMLSSVLNSEQAIQVNILIMRAFVRLRQTLALNKELAEKVGVLEARVGDHDETISQIIDEIDKILDTPIVEAIGFNVSREEEDDGEHGSA
jgi:hypothetical protein